MIEASKSSGQLATYNLWSFWQGLGEVNQQKIIQYFEEHPSMWDFNTLFEGSGNTSHEHGPIHCLTLLLVIKDLGIADYFFEQFLKYDKRNYNQNSDWGRNWMAEKNRKIEIYAKLKQNRTNESEIEELNESQHYYASIDIEDIYWTDTHFFIMEYSKIVYQKFLNGECSIDRFYKAYLLIFNGREAIYSSLKKRSLSGVQCHVFEQYLIYLEKAKEYKKCIEVSKTLINSGFTNDFKKRLVRVESKLYKSSKGNFS